MIIISDKNDQILADGQQARADEIGQILQPNDCEGEDDPGGRVSQEVSEQELDPLFLHRVPRIQGNLQEVCEFVLHRGAGPGGRGS